MTSLQTGGIAIRHYARVHAMKEPQLPLTIEPYDRSGTMSDAPPAALQKALRRRAQPRPARVSKMIRQARWGFGPLAGDRPIAIAWAVRTLPGET